MKTMCSGRVVIALGCMALAASIALPALAQETASGGYKIGVVNMREVFQQYQRQKSEYEKLKKDQETAQSKIDKISAEITAQKEQYDKKKDAMSPDEREQLQMTINSKLSEYQAEFKKLQDDIDLKERKLLKDLFQEITTAVQEVGQAEQYHLILEAGSDGGNAVLYYATPLNLTSKVVEHLNNKS